ncbi:MAG: helix-turn-helix domain-containing protein [Candidatus Brocadiaceae bacterium]|nr:helix-turn-helix domain-containing protein [Candidatus Brocadiaceae bacterium]
MMQKRYVSVKDLSVYTSFSVKSLYEWADSGQIPSIKYGSRVLFDLHDIDKIMEALKRNTSNPKNTTRKIIGDISCN